MTISSQLPVNTTPKPPAQQPPAQQPPAEPKDGFAYSATRLTAGALGGASGFGAGATVGAFKGLVQEKYDHQVPNAVVRATRVVTAAGAGIVGAQMGFALAGIPGAIGLALVSSLAGGVAGGALVGLGEGLFSVSHGALEGGVAGAKKGTALATGLVDRAFGKTSAQENAPAQA